MCPPVRLCLAILYIYLPALDVASSSFDFEKHKLFGVYGGVIKKESFQRRIKRIRTQNDQINQLPFNRIFKKITNP